MLKLASIVPVAKQGMEHGFEGAVEQAKGMATATLMSEANSAVEGAKDKAVQTLDPRINQMLENNDVSEFPNIERAMEQPDGLGMLDRVFNAITNRGAPQQGTAEFYNPEQNNNPVSPELGAIDASKPERG